MTCYNGVNESVLGKRVGGTIYMEDEIKEASGSCSFRRLETVWGVRFRGAAPGSKLKQAFSGENCVHRVPSDVNRMFN